MEEEPALLLPALHLQWVSQMKGLPHVRTEVNPTVLRTYLEIRNLMMRTPRRSSPPLPRRRRRSLALVPPPDK